MIKNPFLEVYSHGRLLTFSYPFSYSYTNYDNLIQVTLILKTDYFSKFIMLLYVDAVIFDLDIKYLREKEYIILKLHNSIHSDVHRFVKV